LNPEPITIRALEAMCRDVAVTLRAALPPGCGFFLSLFDFGDSGWTTYMSNGQRDDMVKFLRELADKLEQRGFG
jgi:hypothetical protein